MRDKNETLESKKALISDVITGAGEYSISTVLFRHAISEKLGINISDMESLTVILFKGFAAPTQIAAYTGLTLSATTAILDRLEKEKIITRCPNPKDRRGTLIVLTKNAEKQLSVLFKSLKIAMNKLISSYTENELEFLANHYKDLVKVWQEEREKLRFI